MIRIVSDGPTGWWSKVTTEDGTPINGITSIRISLEANAQNTAELAIHVAAVDVAAHPLLDFDTVEAAARAYGLIPTTTTNGDAE